MWNATYLPFIPFLFDLGKRLDTFSLALCFGFLSLMKG